MNMPILSRLDAERKGFVSLTVPVHAAREAAIIASLEFTLASAGAVWIDVGKGNYEAARLRRQVAPMGRSGIRNGEAKV